MLSMKGSFLLNILCHATYILIYSLGHVVHLAYCSCILPRWCLLFQPHHFPYSPQTLLIFVCFEIKPNTTNLWNHHHSLVLQTITVIVPRHEDEWYVWVLLWPPRLLDYNVTSLHLEKPLTWNPHLCNIQRAPYLCQPFCIHVFLPWPTFHYSIHGIP
jgi:hypothetical protein